MGRIKRIICYLQNKHVISKWKIQCDSDIRSWAGSLAVVNYGHLSIGKGGVIRSAFEENVVGGYPKTKFYVDHNGVIEIGNKVGISNSVFYAAYRITIKDNVLIGAGCMITDSDHHSIDYNLRCGDSTDSGMAIKPVILEEGCFIGANSIILKGVTIGRHSVVGAGSVVSHSIPQGELWAGNPARFIRKIED